MENFSLNVAPASIYKNSNGTMVLNLHLKNEENYGKKTKIKIMIATLKIVKQRIK